MPKLGMEVIRKKQVLEAVIKLMAQSGMGQVTLDKVAQQAGVSKGVVSYYFENKEALMLEACRTFLAFYASGIRYLSALDVDPVLILKMIGLTAIGRVSEAEALLPACDAETATPCPGGSDIFLPLTTDEMQSLILQIFSKLSQEAAFKTMLHDIYANYLEAITAVIERGVQRNQFRAQKSKSKALQFMALLDGLLIYGTMAFEAELQVEAIDDAIAALLL